MQEIIYLKMLCMLIVYSCATAVSTYGTTPPNVLNSSVMYYPSPYNLEDYCKIDTERVEIVIDPWKAAIFQLGYVFDRHGNPSSRNIHKCRINIRTHNDFWLVASIEHMKMRGSRDITTGNKWKCADYLQFTTPGRHIVGKLFEVFDLDILNDKKSELLCGLKKLDNAYLDNIYDLSTDANSFSTASNKMSLVFHQDDDDRPTLNNSFRVVVTTFRHASESAECEGRQKCYGKDIYCIDKRYICDGHVNCAFPGSGTDEKLCRVQFTVDKKPAIFNMTSLIIIALTSIVCCGLIFCIISRIVFRVAARFRTPRRISNPAFSIVSLSGPPSAPGIEHQESTLPTYETVILSDPERDKTTGEVSSDGPGGELPPKYESLFPDGPTQIVKDET